MSRKPSVPKTPSPSTGASGVLDSVVLSWAPSSNTTGYDVFFDDSSPPTQVVTAQTGTSYDPDGLVAGVTYYWQVAARNTSKVVSGPIWSFTVQVGAPGTPTLIAPGNASTGVSIDANLQWSATNATSCDVYFDTVNPPVTLVSNGQSCSSYNPGTLANSTEYFWKIVARNASGSTTGDVFSFTTISASPPPIPSDGLFHWSTDATWIGGFKAPAGTYGSLTGSHFGNAGKGLAFATTDSLYVTGSSGQVNLTTPQLTAELSIPASLGTQTTGTGYTSWPFGTVLQNFVDPSEGGRAAIVAQANNKVVIGDYLVYGGYLWFSEYVYYDATNAQTISHFRRPLNLSTTGQVVGGGGFLFSLAATGSTGKPLTDYDRWMNGWLAAIPADWQDLLGGKIFSGPLEDTNSGGTSQGPAALAWDPDTFVAGANANTAVPSFYYTLQHPISGGGYHPCHTSRGDCPYPIANQPNYQSPVGDPSTVWNSVTQIGGAVFVEGTRTLLVFEMVGTGIESYGLGVTQQGTAADPFPSGNQSGDYSYDPVNSAKGSHAYPYQMQVKHYDANDFLNTIGGAYPWLVEPYETTVITLPFATAYPRVLGVAYDPATQRVILAQPQTNAVNGTRPFYHVFELTI